MQAALGVLRYLSGTSTLGLKYGPSSSSADTDRAITGFCDSDYANCVNTRRSVTGFEFGYKGTAISWQSKLQPTVARSTTEAEYMAAAAAIAEALWLKKLFAEFGVPARPMLIFSDSQGALAVLKNPGGSGRTKHIDVMHHFARERVMRGDVTMEYISTDRNVADILTKALPKVKFQWCRSHMGVM
jgi:hypothetical protein